MAAIDGAPEFDADKKFDEQSVEYLEWCLDEADARVMQYASELRFHIRQARSKLLYRQAAEANVAALEKMVDKRKEEESKR
jgi:hypothetical protein